MAAIISDDDPVQIYGVEGTSRHLLKVTLKHGTIRGAEPGQEIKASLSISPSGEKEASPKNGTNPEWNELFKFYLDPKKENVLEVSLTIDDTFDKASILLNDLFSDDDSVEKTLTFAKLNGSEIHIQLDVPPKDPMQIYVVEETECNLLKVTLKHGTIIGAEPGQEIKISLSISPSGEKEASPKNGTNPEWNELFKFYLDPKKENVLDVSLTIDDTFDKASILLNDLFSDDDFVEKTLTFAKLNGSEIHIQLDVPQNTASLGSLSQKEEKFIKKRKEKVMKTMKKHFKEDGPNNLHEVPVVGVLGSGGGFRAMIGFSGVLSALEKNGLLDMTCYIAGLSGSAWLLAHIYSHSNWPAKKEEDWNNLMKEFVEAMTTASYYDLLLDAINYEMKQDKEHGRMKLIDHYGKALGKILLTGRDDSTLSGQEAKVSDADVPLPLYSCISLKEKDDAKNWHDWVEFSPYEVGMAKYGLFMDADVFGDEYFIGRCCCNFGNYKEKPLCHLMGIWGSAFNITYQEFKRLGEKLITEEYPEESEEEELVVSEEDQEDSDEEMQMQMLQDDEEELAVSEMTMVQDDDYHEEGLMAYATEERQLDSVQDSHTNVRERAKMDAPRSGVRYMTGTTKMAERRSMMRGVRRFADTNVRERAKMDAPRSGVRKRTGTTKMAKRTKKSSPASSEPKKKVPQSWWRSTWKSVKRGWNKMRVVWHIGILLVEAYIKFRILGRRACPRQIPNFLSHLCIKNKKPVEKPSFFSVPGEIFRNILENQSPDVSSLFLADAGLAYNLPFPLLLRRQRNVDVILSFDFSDSKKKPIDFQELKNAEAWAKKHDIPFPKINDKIHEKEGDKECYVFKDEDNPKCPVVIHFIMANITFKKTAPDPTAEDQSSRNFEIWNGDYSTFKLKYEEYEVHRLQSLMEYNTNLFRKPIEEEIKEQVRLRRLPHELRPKPQKKPEDLSVFTRYVLDPVRNYWAGNRGDKDKE